MTDEQMNKLINNIVRLTTNVGRITRQIDWNITEYHFNPNYDCQFLRDELRKLITKELE